MDNTVIDTPHNADRFAAYRQLARSLEERVSAAAQCRLRHTETELGEEFGMTSPAAVEAWSDAKDAAETCKRLVADIDAFPYGEYPSLAVVDGWELTAYRCERARIWAEHLGVLSNASREAFATYLEPTLKMLQPLRKTVGEFTASWESTTAPLQQMYWAKRNEQVEEDLQEDLEDEREPWFDAEDDEYDERRPGSCFTGITSTRLRKRGCGSCS